MSDPITIPYRSFAAGEVSADLHGRVDQVKYQTGLETCRNFITRPEGSVENRNGFGFVSPLHGVDNSTGDIRLIDFIFNDDQAYVLVLEPIGAGVAFYVIRNGAPIFDSVKAINSITQANPAVITSTAHGFSDDDMVLIAGATLTAGMPQILNRWAKVDNATTNTFEPTLTTGIDSTAYDAYVSNATASRLYRVTLPSAWTSSKLAGLRFTQSGDVLTLTHPDCPPLLIARIADDNWTATEALFAPQIDGPTSIIGNGDPAGSDDIRYKITSVDGDTLEESYPGSVSEAAISQISPTVTLLVTLATISAVTVANPAVVTTAAPHGLTTGQSIYISAVGGMTSLNSKYYTVVVLSVTTFSLKLNGLVDVNSLPYDAYTAGGNVWEASKISVTTATNHGLETGDAVSFSGITDSLYLHLNSGSYTVQKVSKTIYRVDGQYIGLGTSPYAPTAAESKKDILLLESITAPSASAPVALSWSAVDGALEYNIYREINGVYGYIGTTGTNTFEDLGYPIDPFDTPPTEQAFFVGDGEYPHAIGYYQQRLLLGGPDNDPERIRASRTGLFYNFTKSNPLQADDSISWIMASGQRNDIRHFLDMGRLLVFTLGAVFSIEGDDAGTLTTTAINPRLRSEQGVGDVPPLAVNDVALFVQSSGRVIRELLPDTGDRYQSNDLTIYSRHLFNETYITDWCYAEEPTPIVWVTQASGALLGATYLRRHEILGWHRHDTGNGDEFLQVVSIPEGNESALYAAIRRYGVGGTTRTHIERLTSRGTLTELNDGRFFDSWASYDGTNVDGADNVTLVFDDTLATFPYETYTLEFTGVGLVLTADKVGNSIVFTYPDGSTTECIITSVYSATLATCTVTGIENVPGSLPSTQAEWAYGATTLQGLWHLEGRAVYGIFGNDYAGPFTVTNGAIVIDYPATKAVVGLQIVSELKTLEPDNLQGATWVAKDKTVGRIGVRVKDSCGFEMSNNGDGYETFEPANSTKPVKPEQNALYTGKARFELTGASSDSGQVWVRQQSGMPTTVLGLYPEISLGS